MINKVMCDNCKTVIEYEIEPELGGDFTFGFLPSKLNTEILNSGELDEVECPECGKVIFGRGYK